MYDIGKVVSPVDSRYMLNAPSLATLDSKIKSLPHASLQYQCAQDALICYGEEAREKLKPVIEPGLAQFFKKKVPKGVLVRAGLEIATHHIRVGSYNHVAVHLAATSRLDVGVKVNYGWYDRAKNEKQKMGVVIDAINSTDSLPARHLLLPFLIGSPDVRSFMMKMDPEKLGRVLFALSNFYKDDLHAYSTAQEIARRQERLDEEHKYMSLSELNHERDMRKRLEEHFEQFEVTNLFSQVPEDAQAYLDHLIEKFPETKTLQNMKGVKDGIDILFTLQSH